MLVKFAVWQDCNLRHGAQLKSRALMVNRKTQHNETLAVKLMFGKAIFLASGALGATHLFLAGPLRLHEATPGSHSTQY